MRPSFQQGVRRRDSPGLPLLDGADRLCPDGATPCGVGRLRAAEKSPEP